MSIILDASDDRNVTLLEILYAHWNRAERPPDALVHAPVSQLLHFPLFVDQSYVAGSIFIYAVTFVLSAGSTTNRVVTPAIGSDDTESIGNENCICTGIYPHHIAETIVGRLAKLVAGVA